MNSSPDKTIVPVLQTLFAQYDSIKIAELKGLYITHTDVEKAISNISSAQGVTVDEVGKSVEGRAIRKVTIGSGAIPVLLWTQMHGDESTATRAVFDLLQLLLRQPDYAKAAIETILERVTIHIIPMLNPDGAERYTRQNALGIDLNRDAKALRSPESKILMNTFHAIKPQFCYNLHDQSRLYTQQRYALKELQPVAPIQMSFLAPSENASEDYSPNRLRAAELISDIVHLLNRSLPSPIKLGRYSDSYEPRAFGDTLQGLGTSLMLFESGETCSDPEREDIRKYNTLAMFGSLYLIAENAIGGMGAEYYNDLPLNQSVTFDLVLQGVKLIKGTTEVTLDIGLVKTTKLENGRLIHRYIIAEIGDLTTRKTLEIRSNIQHLLLTNPTIGTEIKLS